MKIANLSNGKQVKLGALFSYVLIIANTFYALLITPFILGILGQASYGVYKTVASLSTTLMVLDFGLGGTVMRYIAKYRADGENGKIEPFVSMALCEAGVVVAIIGAVSVAFYAALESVCGSSFTVAEMALAKPLFVLMAVGMIFHIFENVLNGVITGYNNFVFGNGVKIVRLALRVVLIYVFLIQYRTALVLAWVDLGITVLLVLFEAFYIVSTYKIKLAITFKSWDWAVFKESFIYAFLLFLTSIAAQANTNFGNVVVGAFRGPELVAVFAIGMTIFGMFMQLSTAISGVMLPTVMGALKRDEESGGSETLRWIVQAGRVQFALLGAAVVGFAVLGKDFVYLWLGEGFDDVYLIVMILMIPSLFELCVNVCLAVLRAKNKLGFRTIVLFASSALNVAIAIIGVKYWSYLAAAYGTAVSFVVGSLIVMNVYYYKKFGYNMIRVYGGIFDRIWLCLLAGGVALFFSRQYLSGGWAAFLGNVLAFCVVYGACLALYGFTKEEKKSAPIIGKLFR